MNHSYETVKKYAPKVNELFSLFDKANLVGGLSRMKYAYLGQASYHHSVIAVAVKGMLVVQIQCEKWKGFA